MWDGHLDIIARVKHRIEVQNGVKPFRSVPYRAAMIMHEIEKSEVQKMLNEVVSISDPPTD